MVQVIIATFPDEICFSFGYGVSGLKGFGSVFWRGTAHKIDCAEWFDVILVALVRDKKVISRIGVGILFFSVCFGLSQLVASSENILIKLIDISEHEASP